MNLSIVVLTWNDWKSTIDCLQSIINNNYNNYDVILVDNNSNSKHLNFIKKWHNKEISCNSKFVTPNNQRFKKIIEIKKNQIIKQTDRGKKNIFLIKNKKNYGLTKGLNIGYKFSIINKYKYLLRVDNDIFLEKNCIRRLVKSLHNKKIAAISPKILHGYLTKTVWWSEFYMTWFYLKFQGTVNAKKKRVFNNKNMIKIKQVDAIAGACSAYNVKTLTKTNLGDEDFFYGPEDIELSYRLRKIGRLFVNQKAIAFHKVATSSSITGIKNRTFQSTFGFLKLIEKIGTKSDKLIGYLYFILRLFYYKFTKQKEYYDGYAFALKKFFLKKK